MKRSALLAIPLVLAANSAFANTIHGNGALALATLIGAQSPTLSPAEKNVLAHFLDGQTSFSAPASLHTITVTAEKVTCRLGDVDLTMHSCQLTFGSTTVSDPGIRGQALLATMQESGVPGDGAAGSIYFSVAPITCTINVPEVMSPDGGGVTCTYTVGP